MPRRRLRGTMRVLAALLLVAVLAAGCTVPGQTQGPLVTYPREVLGGAPWTRLVIEVDHAPGRAPSEAALAHLVQTFTNVTSKTEVTLLVEETLPDKPQRWTGDALVALEREVRTTPHEAPTALLHVLYPAGTYERDGVAGVTIGGVALGPAVVFLDTLRDIRIETDAGPLPPLAQPQGAVEVLERATLLHEAGHAIGLVNNGLDMVRPHEDTANEGGLKHSKNPESVMYWKVDMENGLREMLLRDGSVPDLFDEDDRADIRAVGGR